MKKKVTQQKGCKYIMYINKQLQLYSEQFVHGNFATSTYHTLHTLKTRCIQNL